MRRPAAVALCALLAAACGPAVTLVRLDPEPAEPRPSDQVVRMYSTQRPRCAYRELGLVTGRRRNGLVSMDRVVDAMRRRAREIGGDAIVEVATRSVVSGGAASDGAISLGSEPVVSGTVVRFTDASCRE
jgi:hypothetical protein